MKNAPNEFIEICTKLVARLNWWDSLLFGDRNFQITVRYILRSSYFKRVFLEEIQEYLFFQDLSVDTTIFNRHLLLPTIFIDHFAFFHQYFAASKQLALSMQSVSENCYFFYEMLQLEVFHEMLHLKIFYDILQLKIGHDFIYPSFFFFIQMLKLNVRVNIHLGHSPSTTINSPDLCEKRIMRSFTSIL